MFFKFQKFKFTIKFSSQFSDENLVFKLVKVSSSLVLVIVCRLPSIKFDFVSMRLATKTNGFFKVQ